MNEKGTCVLESYDFGVTKTSRVRGAVLCETDIGTLLLKEYTGTHGRLVFQEQLLEFIDRSGMENVDCIVRNKENELCTHDMDGTMYIVKRWFQGRECDVSIVSDVLEGAKQLARLHNITQSVSVCSASICKEFPKDSLLKTYDKHNRELKKIRTFLRGLRQKSDFELNVLNCYQMFYEQGVNALEMLKNSSYRKMKNDAVDRCTVIHGNYNYHNVIFGDYGTAVTNFDRAGVNLQILDLYTYLRKVMEKHQWDIKVGTGILEGYSKIKPLKDEERELLGIMLSYPEKFWKILNYYYNSNKSWVSARNMEKLNILRFQDDLKNKFIKVIF